MNRFISLVLTLALMIVSAAAAEMPVVSGSSRTRLSRPLPAKAPGAAASAASAAEALFGKSSIEEAKSLADAALRRDPTLPQALFVLMEAAALEGNHAAELNAALRLCSLDDGSSEYSEIAAGHIRELAANTAVFRRALPRIRGLTATSPERDQLRLALVSAAADGMPEFELLQQSRESGLLTDWRLVGPLGRLPNVDFDRKFPPEIDGLRQKKYGSRTVEYFQFSNGKFTIPKYLRKDGVFYASSKVFLRSGGEWRLRIESPGTMQVFIDGKLAATRDDRRETLPEIILGTQHLEGGDHTVMVKFVAAAAPFRIAIMAPTGGVRRRNKPMLHAGPESQYVSAALQYYRGDANSAILAFAQLAARANSASVQFALARCWAHVSDSEEDEPDDDPPERALALRAAVKLAPSAAAAEEELAGREYAAGHIGESLQHLKNALNRQPQSERALELLSQIAVRYNWTNEATDAFDNLTRIHPSCSNLQAASSFFSSTTQFMRAAEVESQLQHCAPGSLAFPNELAGEGRHKEAALAASEVVQQFPLDREARELEIRERVLDDDTVRATTSAESLAALASNSDYCSRAARDPALLLDIGNSSGNGLDTNEFYRAFRRDGLRLVQENAGRKYSGGPAVILLNDKVALLNDDGSGAIYVHRITRVLDRDGIVQYGEVTVPPGAHVLELRTIKADLTVAEPELNQHKATISMPALAAGDSIEQEYIIPYPDDDALDANPESFEFAFGSFAAPILFSKFVLIAPPETALTVPDTPKETAIPLPGGITARIWERDNIPQSISEAAMPQLALLPSVHLVTSGENPALLRDIALDAALEASRPGTRTLQTLAQVGGASDELMARQLYRLVISRVRSDKSSFASGDVTSSEASLATGKGSRSATLLALAHAAGLDANLALARLAQKGENAYTIPLVLFHFGERTVIADPSSDNTPFGAVAPSLDNTALLIPLSYGETLSKPTIVEIAAPTEQERSLAHGDISFDETGSFTASVAITMGAFRGTEMRNILRGIAPIDRGHFFEQLALRLFPGAIDSTGEALNEGDPDQPLILLVNCRSPRFLDFSGQSVDMDQLVPALGLRRMYTGAATRNFPLYVDALLFEAADFHVHLPAGVAITRNANDFVTQNKFGQYAVTFRIVGPSEVEITREFHIPMQVIPASQYPAFASFAGEIDNAERQRLTLRVSLRSSVDTGNPPHDAPIGYVGATRDRIPPAEPVRPKLPGIAEN